MAAAKRCDNPNLRDTALILVDIQNDFLPPNGSLAVPNGNEILPCVQTLLDDFNWGLVVASAVRLCHDIEMKAFSG